MGMGASLRMARNSAATFAARLLSQGLRAVYVVLVARYLSQEDFGFYAFALSISLVLSILSTLGMESILVREIASHRDRDDSQSTRGRTLFGSVLAYEAMLSLVVVVILVLLSGWLGYQGTRRVAFLLLGGGLIFRQLGESLMGILRGHEHMEYELFFGAVEGLGLVCLTLLFHFLGAGFIGVFLAYLLTYLLQFATGLALVARSFFAPSFARVHRDLSLLREALPVGGARMASSLSTNAGPLSLPLLRTEREAGIYGAAYQPLKAVFLFTRSLGVGVLPVFSQLHGVQDQQSLDRAAANSLRFTSMVVLPLTVGLFAFPELILQLLYGSKYTEGGPVLRVLSLVILMTFFNTLFTSLLIATHRQKVIGLGRIASTVVNFGLLLWLTPRLGALGPAISLACAESTLFAILVSYTIARFRRLPLAKSMLRPALASLCMGGLLWLGRYQSPWLLIPLALAAYLAGLVLVGGLTRSDLNRLASLWSRLWALVSQRTVITKGGP